MQIDKIFGSVYLGRTAGRECNDYLKKAKKEVKIVSPYLSPEYVKKLIKLNEKGIDVTLITCDNVEERGSFSKKELLKQNITVDENKVNIRITSLIFSTIMGLVSLILIFFEWKSIIIFGISIILFLISYNIKTKNYSYDPIFKLKVFNSSINSEGGKGHLIHSKMYVIDNVAFLGSMNFTKNGFINSYESSIKITNKEAVEKIKKEIDWMYENYELENKNLNNWGSELFEEPKN